eukprot:CAMPEP_0119478240 /NCGR_PEP_ID=MMETSP1344-20130328/8069_1 /TAXON_ID=236787 /ORGANISM="Florenciella parvula, Strain CCMP2471" /LENGTH=135 /DNA_ID=CAMNT_0007512395 /DNA_START=522 /DNA_END=925 /DNA_ORIENTATION=-
MDTHFFIDVSYFREQSSMQSWLVRSSSESQHASFSVSHLSTHSLTWSLVIGWLTGHAFSVSDRSLGTTQFRWHNLCESAHDTNWPVRSCPADNDTKSAINKTNATAPVHLNRGIPFCCESILTAAILTARGGDGG